MRAPDDIKRSALLSDCRRYRYRLGRRWGGGPFLLFAMLNPSKADDSIDDPTIRRCMRFAHDHGFAAIEVVNLFAFRATDPSDLKAAGYPVGPENDAHIRAVLRAQGEGGLGAVCVAWGDRARGLARPAQVLEFISDSGHEARCLAVTHHGLPGHPLMLAASNRLQPFQGLR